MAISTSNFTIVDRVDSLSESFCSIKPSIQDAMDGLKQISKEIKDFQIKQSIGLEIEKIKTPLPDEVVVIKFDFTKIDLDTAQAVFSDIKQAFPYNQILGIPKESELKFSPPEVI